MSWSRASVKVPRLWPTLDKYDETIDYDLVDPKKLDQGDADQWRTVTCPADIEYYLKLRNRRHFGQAETDGVYFARDAGTV